MNSVRDRDRARFTFKNNYFMTHNFTINIWAEAIGRGLALTG